MLEFPPENIEWQKSGDPRFPWSAIVGESVWRLRINEFPEAEHLYTLFVDGIETVSFSDWDQPPGAEPIESANSDRAEEAEIDLHEQAAFEAETEWAELSEKLKSSHLVE